MTSPEIALIVLRTATPPHTQNFYETLGLVFKTEQHGNGPKHASTTTPSGTVIEIYPLTGEETLDHGTRGVRLGFNVTNLHETVENVRGIGGTVLSSTDTHAIIQDPDGRKIELTGRA